MRNSFAGPDRYLLGDQQNASDICPCCKFSRSSTSVQYWDCTLPDLRSAVDLGCAKCGFALKCVDWAVPRLFRYGEITRIRVYPDAPMEIYLENPYRVSSLDIFTLSGKG